MFDECFAQAKSDLKERGEYRYKNEQSFFSSARSRAINFYERLKKLNMVNPHLPRATECMYCSTKFETCADLRSHLSTHRCVKRKIKEVSKGLPVGKQQKGTHASAKAEAATVKCVAKKTISTPAKETKPAKPTTKALPFQVSQLWEEECQVWLKMLENVQKELDPKNFKNEQSYYT